MLHPGRALFGGRLRVLSLVRRGPACAVWRALDLRDQREVAIKVMPAEAGGPQAAELEADAAARVRHPAVVEVFATFEEDGHGFVVMELAWCNLQDVVERWGPLGAAEARAVGRSLAGALGAAHAAGVVHRDIKPQNVLVRANGEVCLSDFGIALVHARGQGKTGALLGTLPFMPHEQRRDARDVLPATDVYAWAVLMAWARTGALPGDLYVAEAQEALRAALAKAGEPDNALADLLVRCGAYSPRDRPRDGAALLAALEAAWPGPSAPVSAAALELPVEEEAAPAPATAPAPAPPRAASSMVVVGIGVAVLILLVIVALGVALSAGAAGGWPGRSAPELSAPPVSAAVAAVQAWEALPACPGSARLRSTRSHPNTAADGPGLEEAQPPTVDDLDGDGHLDLIVPHQLGARTLIWWGPLSAAGWFEARTELALGRACGPAAVGDLNGDGHPDLAHTLCENGGLVVQTMQGRAPLGPPARDEQGSEPRGGAITDWDHDGRNDLALWLMSGKVVVRRSTPGGLAPPVVVGTSEGPIAAAPEGGLAVLLDGQVQVLAIGRPRLTLPTPPFSRVLRLMPGPSEGLIVVGEGPTGIAAALVRLDGGAACRYPGPPSKTAALADINGDGLMDEADVVTCGYCTSSYRVGIGG